MPPVSAAIFWRLGHDFLDRADHVEGLLGILVVFAVHDRLEAADGVGQLHELAGRVGELLGDKEGLAEEALDLAGARHGQLVVFRQFIHAQDGDDVLQRLVLLQHFLHAAGDSVMLLADHLRVENARGGVQRIHRRENASAAMSRDSTVVASRCAKEVAGAGSVRSSAGT